MNAFHDPELDDVLQDDELRRVAALLKSASTPEAPLDEAFRTGLRRQLMSEAWSMTEGRGSWWRRAIGPEARTASGKKVAAPQTITFVTQPPAPAAQSPAPRATPSNALGEKQLAVLTGATALKGQWSADSSTLYVIDGTGALKVLPANGAGVTVIAADGVTSLAISPAGDRLAYVRNDKIEVLTFASGQTQELAPNPAPSLVGWAKDKLLWAAADGIDTHAADESTQQ